jgi:two-component system chemotaxis response regulator CheB
MPDMDGVAFIKEQMSRQRLPIVVMSVANGAGDQVLAALEAGAVDFVHKPTALASQRLLEVTGELIQKVKSAAAAVMRDGGPHADQVLPVVPMMTPRAGAGKVDIVVLGISTGGPQGLKLVVPRLPQSFPVPLAIVLHMPIGYTELYARKLNDLCALDVTEAREGDEIVAGRVFLAPAGRHLSFRRAATQIRAHLDVRPLDTPHRPAVDVLFQSAADVYGERTLGIVMTGMGADGRDGAAWIKAKGGRVLTESEESCVVYGMPRSVVEAGLSDSAIHIDRMADAIAEHV